ncbi:MAG: hypothetical protein HRU70_01605 [Phycisphaeraceae bacterium]|nr:MAG: hypothetical protein HRU70_01605 [Phycisphaeraceae bacterium]
MARRVSGRAWGIGSAARVLLVVGAASWVVAGCGPTRAPLRDPGSGAKVADPNRPFRPLPGTPAQIADTGTPRTDPAVVARQTPARPAPAPVATPTRPSRPDDGREAAIDLAGDRTPAARPAETPAARPEPVRPAETVARAEPVNPAPARPAATDGRAAAIDLVDAPAPAAARPSERPATPAERPQPVAPPAVTNPTRAATTPADRPEPAPAVTPGMVSLNEVRERALDVIADAFRTDDEALRANAVEAAGIAPNRLDAVITGGLRDRNPGVRAVAAMTIGKQRLYSLAKQVAPLLNDPSPYVETAAVMASIICNEPIDDRKVTRLAQVMWESDQPKLRAHVAFLIGEIGNSSGLPMLKQAASARLPKAPLAEVNLMLLQFHEAMVKLGDNDQVEVIRAALHPSRPEDLEVAALAAQILGELKDRRPVDQMVYLSAYRDSATGQMYPPEIRMSIAAALANLGLDRGGFIADEYAASPDPLQRAQAATVYGNTGRGEHVPKLARMLGDPDPRVRLAAAHGVLKVHRRASTSDASR